MIIDKTKVKDAMRKLQLTITKRDINGSKRGIPESCAAAKCLMRMDGVDEAIVYRTRTYVRRGNVWTRYVTPMSLKIELVAFDRGGTFEPGEHFLLPVPHYERPTGKRQGSDKDQRKGTSSRSYHRISNIRRSAFE